MTCKLTILNRNGLHARPASVLVRAASEFDSDIYVTKNENTIDAKSIIGVITLAVAYGEKITVKAIYINKQGNLDNVISEPTNIVQINPNFPTNKPPV